MPSQLPAATGQAHARAGNTKEEGHGSGEKEGESECAACMTQQNRGGVGRVRVRVPRRTNTGPSGTRGHHSRKAARRTARGANRQPVQRHPARAASGCSGQHEAATPHASSSAAPLCGCSKWRQVHKALQQNMKEALNNSKGKTSSATTQLSAVSHGAEK